MKLQEIFDHLKAGEFSQLNFGAGQGIVDEDDATMLKVLSHINLGLTDLFTRFELRRRRLQLTLQAGQTSYLLTSKHAENGRAAVDPKYIIDTVADPFKDDVLLVSQIFTDDNFELPLNRLDVPYSLQTSAMNRIEVPLSIVEKSLALPSSLITNGLTVVYRANHATLNPNIGAFDPERLEIELPASHLTALLYFTASRANNPVGLGQEFNAGNTYAAKYEVECLRLKTDGMEIQQRGNESRFAARGFV